MIPVKLSLSGFLSYREPVTLDFTGIDLACISGSNGAGKSSLLDAITWALFGQARKRDESIIHTACQKAEVTLDFLYENTLYRVHRTNQRGKSTTVDFFIHDPQADKPSQKWKTLSERTLRDTDALIENTLRLDYDTFINASFFLQGKADQFATQRPADRKRILGSILGLDIWEKYREKAALERKEQESEVRAVDARLNEIMQELSEEKIRKQRLKELEDQLAVMSKNRIQQEKALQEVRKLEASLKERKNMLDTLGKQLDSAAVNRNRNEELLLDRQSELAEFEQKLAQAEIIEAAYQSWQKDRLALSELDQVAEKFQEVENRRRQPLMRIEAERARLLQEISNLEENLVKLEQQESGLKALQVQLETTEHEMQKFQAQIEQRMALEERMRELHQEQAEAKAENPRLNAEMKELKERIDKLQQTEGSQCPLCGQPLAEKERLALLVRLQIEGKERGDRYRANQALMNEFDERLNDLNQQMNDLNRIDEQLRAASRQHDQTKDRINQIKEMRKQWDEQYAPYLMDLKTRLKKESFLPQEHELLIKIDKESKSLGYDAAAHAKLRQVELEGRQFETAFNDLGKARAALVPLKREIENIKLQLDRQNEEVTQLRQAYDNAAAQLAADQALMPDLLAAEQSLMDARESENRLRYEVGGAQQKVAVLDVIRQRRKDLDQEREVLTRRIEQLKLLEKSFGKMGCHRC